MVNMYRRFLLRAVSIAVVICGLVLVAGPACAQMLDGSIIGQITDENGLVLPGVTVTVSGDSLQVRQFSVVSNADGEYRLTPLPFGNYTVEYALSGFKTLRREGLQLTTGFVAKIDVVLQLGFVEESIVVSGQSPVVDNKSTTVGTQLTVDVLKTVPNGRNGLASLLTMGAGVRTASDFGQVTSQDPFFRAFGRSNQAWITIDGTSTTSPWNPASGSANVFDYQNIEEATIQTVGSAAESPTSGIQLSVITKSGGNKFHGSASASQFGRWMQANNIDDGLRALGITAPQAIAERWDRSAELGGRIVSDNLWFYGNVRQRNEASAVAGLFAPDGSPALIGVKQEFAGGKITYQLNSSQRLDVSYLWVAKHNNGSSSFTNLSDYDSRSQDEPRTRLGTINWQLVKSNKIVSIQGGVWSATGLPRGGFSTEPAAFDQVTGRTSGVDPAVGSLTVIDRYEEKGTMSWYKPNLFAGSHDFKFGASYSRSRGDAGSQARDPMTVGNYQLIYRNGVPFEVAIRNSPEDVPAIVES